MANFNVITKKMSNTKLKLSDLNPHLMCVLCGGYYIDATTIVECLHSFCRSCIVKHLEGSKYCPICEVQVHKTKPLINIRPDKTLQDIVYKLVPGLFANEMRKRRKFYKERPQYIKPNDLESSGELPGERKIYINDENITFSLVYHEGPGPTSANNFYREFPPPAYNERRYFKCPTGVTIQHLKKLIKAKYELSDNNYKLEVYFRDQELQQDFTLLDVAYIYLWKTKGTLDLTYKIFENIVKRQKIEEKPERVVVNIAESEESEISKRETENVEKEEEVKKEEEEVESEKDGKKMETEISEPEAVSKTPEIKPPEPVTTSPEPAKENGLVGTEVKEVHLQISESGVMSVSQVEDSEVVGMVEETPMIVPGNQLIKGNNPVGQAKTGKKDKKLQDRRPTGKPPKPYKTVGCAPKTWHPFIPKEKLRPTLMKNSDEPRKPFKFFKNRNMPRFLGNPSSGVKPMFAEAAVKQEKKKSDTEKIINKIIKIDPKTLRPIEKEEMKISSTPSAPNLLTNPFIPNNNHFLFSNLHLLPPNSGNYKDKSAAPGGFKAPVSNGSFPSICFPTPEHSPPGFYPFGNLTKPPTFPFPSGDKMDPLLRASRLSPFGNLAGFNVAGFHASLPPSISRLLNPHHNFRKISQSLENKSKDESTKETIKRCDDSLKKVSKVKEENENEEMEEAEAEQQEGETKVKEENKKEESLTTTTTTTTTVKEVEEEKEKEKDKEGEGEMRKQEINGEKDESASDIKSDVSASLGEKDKDKDKDR